MPFIGRKVGLEVNSSTEHLKDTDGQDLKQLHIVTSGLKALFTSVALEQIEICRQSCGGHGYSLASGLPTLYVNFAPTATYEGDNSVMLL
jgi:acyl-CoA oxidase